MIERAMDGRTDGRTDDDDGGEKSRRSRSRGLSRAGESQSFKSRVFVSAAVGERDLIRLTDALFGTGRGKGRERARRDATRRRRGGGGGGEI